MSHDAADDDNMDQQNQLNLSWKVDLIILGTNDHAFVHCPLRIIPRLRLPYVLCYPETVPREACSGGVEYRS